MRINMNAKFMVVGKKAQKSEKNGKDYFSLAVVNESGEAGNVSCNDTTFNNVTDLFKMYQLALVFNDQYNFLQAVDAFPAK